MALTATFAADFERFESSLKSASFQLQVFDRATAKSMQSLKKDVESFSGQKIAVEAARMAEAVTRLGGSGGSAAGLLKLLPDELKRVSTALDLAAAKAAKLGETLPPSLQKVRDEIAALPKATLPATSGIGTLSAAFMKLGPLIGVTSFATAAAGLVRLGTSALDSAGQIVDLSEKTGLSTKAIQQMQAVALETGSTVDAFADATFKLGVNVSEGSTKARDAIKALGLEYTALKSLRPEDQFDTVVRALERVESTQDRNRIGVALFGRQFKEIAGSIAEGYGTIADSAAIAGDAQLRALEKAGDAWEKFKNDFAKGTQTMLGNLVLTIQAIERASDAMTNWQKFNLWLKGGFSFDAYLSGLKQIGDEMQTLDEAADRIIKESKLQVPASAVESTTDYVAALKEIHDTIAGLKPEQVAQLNAAIKLGGDDAQLYADKIGLGADGLRVFQSQAKGAEAEAKKLAKTMEESIVWGDGIQEAARWMARLADESRALELPKTVEFAKIFEMGPDVWIDEFQDWLDTRADALRRFHDAHAKDITSVFEFSGDPGIAAFQDTLDKAAASLKGRLADVFAQLPATLARAFEGGGDLAGAFKSLGVQIGDAIVQPIIKKMTQLQSMATSIGGGIATALGGATGGGAGATIASMASNIGAAALATTAFGAAAASSVGGAIALGAATAGIGAAAVGVFLVAKHFLTVSKAVKEARKNLDEFTRSMNESLTKQQQLEAGGQQWAATLIQVRDAMIALGTPLADALARSQKLVADLLNTNDPDASRRAMQQIAQLMQTLDDARTSAGGIFDEIVKVADEGIPDFLQPHINQLIELGLLTEEQADQLRDLADAGATNWAKVTQAAEKYGVRIESLGQPFNAQRIGADAADIINAFTRIVDAGGDVGGVLFDMQDEISKVVQQSRQFGTSIPENMRPWIEELARAGLLVDENGELIKDLSTIQFGAAIETEAEKTRKAFEGITEAIRELIRAMNSIPDRTGGGMWSGGGGVPTLEPTPGTSQPSLTAGAIASIMGGSSARTTFNVPIQIDGRTVADVVIDQMGNRLSVRGAR